MRATMVTGKDLEVKPAEIATRGGVWAAWNRFWFLSADPTPLGLMRIITGSLVLYVHLVYCLELTEFFGPHAWLSLEAANRERKEQPAFATPLGWRQGPTSIRLPETAHRRKEIFEFLRRLPDDPNERMNRLIVITTLFEVKGEEIGLRRRFFADYAALSKEQRQQLRRAIEANANELPLALPEFLRQAPAPQKLSHLDEMDALLAMLPPASDPAFAYALDWFQDLSTPERLKVFTFIEGLPRSRTERLELLNYFETWNSDPRCVYAQGKTVFSHWFHLQDRRSMQVVHGIALVIFFLFTIGLWTRVTSVLSWLAALGYMHRSPPVLFGMDTMISILLLYMMIGPSGAALSVDRLRARFRAARAIASAGGKSIAWAEATLAGPRCSALANLTLRLFQVHFCFIYASTGFAKVRGATWWNHTAGWMTLANPGFSLIYNHYFEALVLMLAEVRPLLAALCGALVLLTLVLEIGLPILVWTRLRPYMVIGAIFLHSGIAFLMGLTPFGLLMMTLLLAYIPASVMRRPPAWIVRPGQPVTVRFDVGNPIHQRIVGWLRALDVAGQVTFQSTATAEVTLAPALNNDLATNVLKSLALLKPLSWVPGMKMVFRRVVR